jgi:hypothetical protein
VQDDKILVRRNTRECINQVVGVTPDTGKMILDVAPVNGK